MHWPLGLGVSALAAGSLLASLLAGVPKKMPGAALESAVILHAERALGLFIVAVLALLVVVRAFQGALPDEMRGVKYTPRETTREIKDATAEALTDLVERVEALEKKGP